jgi:hypothetical protein
VAGPHRLAIGGSQGPRGFTGPVRRCIRLTPPTKQPFELDNRCKATIDLLVAHRVIESDDCNTVRVINLALDTGEPGTRIEVTGGASGC